MKNIIIAISLLAVTYIGYIILSNLIVTGELEYKIAHGAVILDVRTDGEYANGHIDSSINISLGTIRERYTELDPKQTYITTCSHGLRSIKAASILKEHGFEKAYNGGAISDIEKIINAQKNKR